MPEKGKGQGYVFFNKQRKKWNAQYMEYDAKTGISKPKTKSFKTEAEAKKYLSTVMYQKENPIFIEHNGIPLIEVMKSNLKLKFDTNQISSTQYGRVTHTLDALTKVPMCQKNIDDITSEEIQSYMNSIKHLSNSSIDKAYDQFNQAFKVAINKGYLMRNPMINVLKPKSLKEDKKIRALTVDEQQAFTEYLLSKNLKECKYKNIFLIQMYMGLRVSEVLALTTHDIDLRNKRMNVNTALHRIMEKEFGITDIATHSLRHSYGTRCIESGMAPVVVQKLMGHNDISVTLNTYTDVYDKFKESEIDKVNQYYMNENLISNNSSNYITNNPSKQLGLDER